MATKVNPANDTAVLPAEAKSAVRAMTGIIRDLEDLIRKETNALISGDSLNFIAVQEDKEKFAEQYERASGEFHARFGEFRRIDKNLLDELKKAQSDFDQLMRENIALLAQYRKYAGDYLGSKDVELVAPEQASE